MLLTTRVFGSLLASLLLAVWTPQLLLAADSETSAGVDEALDHAIGAEVRGDTTARDASLAKAISIDPANLLARSMLGQIRDKRGWVDVEELMADWSTDPVIVGYHQLRKRVQATPQGQLMLARYCSKHDLRDRADFHWRLVLMAQPRHREAVQRLGLREHRGALMTKDQITRYEEARTKFFAASKRVKQLAENAEEDEVARIELRGERDPYAAAELHRVALQSDEPIASAALDALCKIDSPQTTAVLVHLAINAPLEAIGERATAALKHRPQTESIPLLLGALATPVHVSGDVQQIGGQQIYSIRVRREGPQAEFSHMRYGQIGPRAGARRPPPPRPVADANRRVRAQLARVSRDAAAVNIRTATTNDRVFAILQSTTGQQLEPRPQAWWDWWADQNDIYRPQYKPEIDTYTQVNRLLGCECFLAGTLVWTEVGKTPIERLRAGDRVLTCDPDTGELSFRFVLATTVRPAENTTRLRLKGEDLVATDGHPMWVVGKGWRQAKDIQAGARLRGVHQSLTVEAVERGPEAQVYNLVVEGINNYFVGNEGALAHDNTLRRRTNGVVPGYVAKSK